MKGYTYISHKTAITAPALATKTNYQSLLGDVVSPTESDVRIPIAENTAKRLVLKIISITNLNFSIYVRKNGLDTSLQILDKVLAGLYAIDVDVDFADGDEISIFQFPLVGVFR